MITLEIDVRISVLKSDSLISRLVYFQDGENAPSAATVTFNFDRSNQDLQDPEFDEKYYYASLSTTVVRIKCVDTFLDLFLNQSDSTSTLKS